MPVYEYVCMACEHRFERLTTSTSDPEPACPTCGQVRVRKQFSVFASPAGGASSPSPGGGGGGCCGGSCGCGS